MGLQERIYNSSPLFVQNLMISAYGFMWQNRRFGGVFSEELHKAKDRESFTFSQWQNYQNDQLTNLLIHAKNEVPFYQQKFLNAGLSESELKKISIVDLSQLPILSKNELREFGTTTLIANKLEPKGEYFASSGSTGTPTKILFSYPMHQKWSAIFEARIRHWAGVNIKTPRGMIGGRRVLPDASNKPPFYRYNFFEKQVYFSAYHINATNAANYVHAINKYDLGYMTGYAMSNYFLARFIKEEQLKVKELKAVITSSEKLTSEMRQLFKEVYNCKTYDSWSGVEACALVTECEHGSLHISPDAGIIELLDDDMKPVAAGQPGNVYCTGFLNYDQPLIRYAIGDSMIMSDKKCSCGREMPVIEEIVGRVEDVVIGNDGREMVRFHGIFVNLTTVGQAQVIQEKLGELLIKIVPVGLKVSDEEKQIMRNRVVSQLGDIKVDIEEVKEIPLTSNGKFKAVISKVKRK